MKKVFLLAVFFAAISACGKQETVPDDILSEDQMVDILIDIRTAEGKVSTLNLSKDSSANLYAILERRIFEKHELDTTVYTESYNYYILHPERLLAITDRVIDSLKLQVQTTFSSNYQRGN